MSKLEQDIKAGIMLLNGTSLERMPYGYDEVFAFTNEYLSEYYPKFPIERGRVLTIASGGDHILQAVLDKPKSIDAFDVNRLAIYFSKLKIAAVRALNYENFLRYFQPWDNFDSDLGLFLNDNIYSKIREYLDEDTKKFWDAMYIDGKLIWNYGNMLLAYKYYDTGSKSYIHERNFYKTKEHLNEVLIKFYQDCFPEIFKLLPPSSKYDAIFLSNIYDWLSASQKKEFSTTCEKTADSYLNDNGMMAMYAPPIGNKEIKFFDKRSTRLGGNSIIVLRKTLKNANIH